MSTERLSRRTASDGGSVWFSFSEYHIKNIEVYSIIKPHSVVQTVSTFRLKIARI